MKEKAKVYVLDSNYRIIRVLKGKLDLEKNEFVQSKLFGKKEKFTAVNPDMKIYDKKFTAILYYQQKGSEITQISFKSIPEKEGYNIVKDYIQTYKISELQKNSMLDIGKTIKYFEISLVILLFIMMALVIITYFGVNQYIITMKNTQNLFNKTYGSIIVQNQYAISHYVNLTDYSLKVLNETIAYLKSHTLLINSTK